MDEILANLSNENNNIRKLAEESYNANLQKDPHAVIQYLCSVISRRDINQSTVLLASILLRGSIMKDLNYVPFVKNSILQLLVLHPNINIIKNLSDVVATILSQDKSWTEFMNVLNELITNRSIPEKRFIGYLLLERTVLELFPLLKDQVLSSLKQGLVDEYKPILISSAKMTIILLQGCSKKHRTSVQNILPLVLTNLQKNMNMMDVCDFLEELDMINPKFMGKHFKSFVQFVLHVIRQSSDITDPVIMLGLQFIVGSMEVNPDFCKNDFTFIPTIIDLMIDVHLHFEEPDIDEWTKNEIDDEFFMSMCQFFERFVANLPENTISIVMNRLSSLLTNDDWRKRYVGMALLHAVIEPFSDEMKSNYSFVLEMITHALKDTNIYVREYAISSLGEMGMFFSPEIGLEFSNIIIPALLEFMVDPNLKIKTTSAGSLGLFLTSTDDEINIDNYVDNIMNIAINNIQINNDELQKMTLLIISIVALYLDSKFEPYHDKTSEILIGLLSVTSNETKWKILLCLTRIAEHTRLPSYQKDVKFVLEYLLHDSNPCYAEMLDCWINICRYLGSQIQPYIPVIFPLVMSIASSHPEDELSHFIEDQQKNDINTSAMEEKETACYLLHVLVKELKQQELSQEIINIFNLARTLLTYQFDEDIRIIAAKILVQLFHHMRTDEFFHRIFDTLLSALQEEEEEIVVDVLYEKIGELLKSNDSFYVKDELLETLFNQAHLTISEIEDDDSTTLKSINYMIYTMHRNITSQQFNHFYYKHIHQFVQNMMFEEFSLSILNSAVNHCPDLLFHYKNLVKKCIKSKDENIRSNAISGYEHFPFREIVKNLQDIIQNDSSNECKKEAITVMSIHLSNMNDLSSEWLIKWVDMTLPYLNNRPFLKEIGERFIKCLLKMNMRVTSDGIQTLVRRLIRKRITDQTFLNSLLDS